MVFYGPIFTAKMYIFQVVLVQYGRELVFKIRYRKSLKSLTDSLFFLNKKVAIKIPTIQDLTKKQLDSFRREVEIMRLNFSLFNILSLTALQFQSAPQHLPVHGRVHWYAIASQFLSSWQDHSLLSSGSVSDCNGINGWRSWGTEPALPGSRNDFLL